MTYFGHFEKNPKKEVGACFGKGKKKNPCNKLNTKFTVMNISLVTIFVVTNDMIGNIFALWSLEICTAQSTIISSEKYLNMRKLRSISTFVYIFSQNQSSWVRSWVTHMTRLETKNFQKMKKVICFLNYTNKWRKSIKNTLIAFFHFFVIKMYIFA